jgi:hypothetical protein
VAFLARRSLKVNGSSRRGASLLAEAARTDEARGAFSVVYEFPDLWARMDAPACERAGQCPVLLLDLNFESAEWWRRATVSDTVARAAAPVIAFNPTRAGPLIREILTEARGSARALPLAARLVFGMNAEVCGAVAALSAANIERISTGQMRELAPRWPNTPAFWRRLLEAAAGDDSGGLTKVRLHCIQLLGSDLAVGYS